MSMDDFYTTIVIGGGQAGLAAGYYLAQRGERFTILDENRRTGEAWRRRWDSLRLFTPGKYNGLPGLPFPGDDFCFPTKDEAADYLEQYARQFNLPVQHNVKVTQLARGEAGFAVSTSAGSFSARTAIIATGPYQRPYTPPFARGLEPELQQMHSSAYCNPGQIAGQKILVVGAGNSGAEISLELARAGKQVWLAGADVGRIPAGTLGRVLGGRPYWWLISRVLSVNTPMGRKMMDKVIHHGAPLIRASREEVSAAGIERTPRVTGVLEGQPQLDGGRSLAVDGIIWATGFRPDYGWIDLAVFAANGFPRHRRGVVAEAPGLYFVGLPFQSALSSALLGGVGEEARWVVGQMRTSI